MEYNPVCIFAEGTTSNGTSLLKFKRGAFAALRTVIPVFARVNSNSFAPTFEVVEFWPLLIMYLSSLCCFNLELTIMPEFTPTEWMLEQHAGKGEHDWEVFAECVREAMAKAGNFEISERTNREKLAYEYFMCGQTEEVMIDGKTFRYNSRGGGQVKQ